MDAMLRIHLMQNWLGYSDRRWKRRCTEVAPLRRFAGLSVSRGSVPDEATILNLRHLLETHSLAPAPLAAVNARMTDRCLLLRQGTIVDATTTPPHYRPRARRSCATRTCTMQARATSVCGQLLLCCLNSGIRAVVGMEAHIGIDAESGPLHTVTTTPAHAADVVEVGNLLHGEEKTVYADADAGYTDAENRNRRTLPCRSGTALDSRSTRETSPA